MSSKFNKGDIEFILQVLVSILAIFAIRSLLKDDSGKLISEEGSSLLDDDDFSKKIDQKLEKFEDVDNEEITIDLP